MKEIIKALFHIVLFFASITAFVIALSVLNYWIFASDMIPEWLKVLWFLKW